MAELQALSPLAGLLPMTIGDVRIAEMDMGPVHGVAPLRGASQEALEAALGMRFPEPGRVVRARDARCVWWGRGQAMLMGRAVPEALSALCAVTDQSDGWVFVSVEGQGVEAVLARLVPVDLRLSGFGVGATARTLVGHMHASVTRTGDACFMVAVFRSMAGTLVHDLRVALEAVAARG